MTAASTEDGDSKLMLVMDSSGSMAEPAGGGITKIEAAKESLHTVIDTLPSEQPLGLRVYGAQVRGESDPNACTDSQLVVPVGAGNPDRLRDAVNGYQPVGATPIGYALQEAGDDLGNSGRRNIILVSDGESTCQPDPCTVSRQLRSDGIDLRIDVVGLNVTGQARNQLQCVAQTGGGVYYDAHDPQQLTDSLTKLVERAARPYETIGQPVTGAKNWKHAPTIRAGDWQDELPRPPGVYDGHRVYKIERQLARSTLFISAAYRAPDGASNLELSLSAPDGTECGSGYDSQLFTDGMLLSVGTRAGQLGDENQPIAADDPCLTGKQLAATVTYSDTEKPVPVELRVTELPEITNLDDLDEPTETPEWTSPDADSAEVTGGASFGDAEQLEPGGYAGTIVPGETLTYAVDVDWGEQLNAAAHIDQLTGALGKTVAGQPSIYLQVFGPARLPAGTTEAATDLAADAILGDGGSDDLGLTTGPVTYRNIGYNAGAAQAGTYTITLYLEDNDQNASLPVPYDLGIDVSGDATDAPAYDEQSIGTTDAGPADTGSDAAAPPAGPGTTDDDGGGVLPWDWIIGLALLAAMALLLVRLRHRDRPSAASPGGTRVFNPSMVRPRTPEPSGPGPRRRAGLVRRFLLGARDVIASRPTMEQLPEYESTSATPAGPNGTPTPRPSPTPAATTAEEVLAAAHPHGLGVVGPGARKVAHRLLGAIIAGRLVDRDGRQADIQLIVPEADFAHVINKGIPGRIPHSLTTTKNLEAALDRLETEIVTRTREHNENDQSGWAAARGQPRIVLLARPAPGVRDRLAAVLDNGASYGITGVILGPWKPGNTVTVDPDEMRLPNADSVSPDARPSTSLPGNPWRDLTTHNPRAADPYRFETFTPISTHRRRPQSDPGHVDDTRAGQGEDRAADSSGSGTKGPAEAGHTTDVPTTASARNDLVLSLFGPPVLVKIVDGEPVDVTEGVRRPRVLELLYFLGLHPDGISRDTLIATLWPDGSPDRPRNGLYITARRLRDALRNLNDDPTCDPVIVHDNRYRLDPDIISVDYWDFVNAIDATRTATTNTARQAAYEAIVATYRGTLCQELNVDWIETPRRDAQRSAVTSICRLAHEMVDTNADRSLDLLETARTLDPNNESIYRYIMQTQHRLGLAASITSTLDLLTVQLAEIDERPHPDTLDLARRLQEDP